MNVTFKSFEALKNARNLTDEQLATVLANPCAPSNEGSYEDGLTRILLAWLSAATGIEWRRAFEHSDRLEKQYATIQLLTAQPFSNVQLQDFQPSEDKLCVVLSEPKLYTFQLDVYKDNGNIESQQDASGNTTPVSSAFDVLNRLQTRTKHFIFAKALSEYCIFAGRQGFITDVRNMPMELRHSTNEARATAMLHIMYTPQNSISSGTIGSIETEFCFETGEG